MFDGMNLQDCSHSLKEAVAALLCYIKVTEGSPNGDLTSL